MARSSTNAYNQALLASIIAANGEKEAEAWAKRRGAGKIALTSALHRVEAHDFYKRLGYEHTGVRLARELSG